MDDVKKLDAAIVSEPMMGSQAYSLVLVRLKDKADAADIAQKMADGINPRKWVCVEADELTVVSKDNIIMLFMADHELYSMDDAVAAFTEVCGNPDNIARLSPSVKNQDEHKKHCIFQFPRCCKIAHQHRRKEII